MAFVQCECGFEKDDIPSEYIGKKAKCSKCGSSIIIKEKETSEGGSKISSPPSARPEPTPVASPKDTASGLPTRFPEITVSGGKVNPKMYIEPGTRLAVFLAFFVAILGTLIGIIFSYGILLIVLIIYPLFAWYFHRKSRALIHGSGICVSETQFPEIHRCVRDFADRLDLKSDVDVYIVEANIANAAAVKYGKKNLIIITDDLIHGCLASGHPEALAFVIGHELAHISLNHNGVFRSWMAQHMKKLGRLNEYSADAVAFALVGEKEPAFHGICFLLSVMPCFLMFTRKALSGRHRKWHRTNIRKKPKEN